MAYDLQEQEQIDELKAFWSRYGNLILGAITVALFAYAGVKGWGWYQARQAGDAAILYEQLGEAVERKDVEQIRGRSADLRDKFGGTVYGQMAGLVAAKGLLEGNDAQGARSALQWVADKGKDAEFRLLARLRLAGLMLDEKQFDDALKQLDSGELAASSAEMQAAFADRRGDIQLAQGRKAEAKAEFDKALAALPAGSPLRAQVQLKRDATGG